MSDCQVRCARNTRLQVHGYLFREPNRVVHDRASMLQWFNLHRASGCRGPIHKRKKNIQHSQPNWSSNDMCIFKNNLNNSWPQSPGDNQACEERRHLRSARRDAPHPCFAVRPEHLRVQRHRQRGFSFTWSAQARAKTGHFAYPWDNFRHHWRAQDGDAYTQKLHFWAGVLGVPRIQLHSRRRLLGLLPIESCVRADHALWRHHFWILNWIFLKQPWQAAPGHSDAPPNYLWVFSSFLLKNRGQDQPRGC